MNSGDHVYNWPVGSGKLSGPSRLAESGIVSTGTFFVQRLARFIGKHFEPGEKPLAAFAETANNHLEAAVFSRGQLMWRRDHIVTGH